MWRASTQNQIYPFCQNFRTSHANCRAYGVLYWNPNFERDFGCNLSHFDWWNFASWCRPGWTRFSRRKTYMCEFGVHRVSHWSPSCTSKKFVASVRPSIKSHTSIATSTVEVHTVPGHHDIIFSQQIVKHRSKAAVAARQLKYVFLFAKQSLAFNTRCGNSRELLKPYVYGC